MTNENDSNNTTAAEVRSDSDNGPNNQQETAKELAREFRWVEVTSLIINGALAVIGIIALCIYHGQLTVMSRQLTEMHNAREQAKTDNARAISAQQQIAQQGLSFSQQSADKSFAATVAQFNREQRAWVGLDASQVDQFGLNTFFEAQLKFFNSGRTPALHLHSAMGYRINPKFLDGPAPENIADLEHSFRGNDVIAPQASTIIHVDDVGMGLQEVDIAGVRTDGLHWYYQQL